MRQSARASPGAARPLVLNTGRIRDQWHTMTRTGKTPRLMAQAGEPFLELHPADAAARGLAAADLAEVESAHGTALLRIVPTTRVRRGEAFAPMHWTDRFAPAGRVGALIAGATDPVSGQPELKATPIEARRFPAAWFAFAVSCARPDAGVAEYVALAPARGGFRVELASRTTLDDPEGFAARLLHLPDGAERVAYCDPSRGEFRFAAFAGETFVGALFLAPGPVAAARDAIAARLGETVPRGERMALLAGRVGAGVKDKGPIVCACFEVGRREIADAIAAGAATADAVGAVTRAGANCGSCRPEIKALLDAAPAATKIAV